MQWAAYVNLCRMINMQCLASMSMKFLNSRSSSIFSLGLALSPNPSIISCLVSITILELFNEFIFYHWQPARLCYQIWTKETKDNQRFSSISCKMEINQNENRAISQLQKTINIKNQAWAAWPGNSKSRRSCPSTWQGIGFHSLFFGIW